MKKTKIKPQYKLYILMRNDLPSMNAGKAMAQAAHAANAFAATWGHLSSVKEWAKEGKTFGTTIALAADKDTIGKVLKRAHMRDGTVPFGPVYDDTYPFITTTEIAALIPKSKFTAPPIAKEDNRVMCFRKELTCAYVFVAANTSDQADLVGSLPLHP
jgi:hypothetical protein